MPRQIVTQSVHSLYLNGSLWNYIKKLNVKQNCFSLCDAARQKICILILINKTKWRPRRLMRGWGAVDNRTRRQWTEWKAAEEERLWNQFARLNFKSGAKWITLQVNGCMNGWMNEWSDSLGRSQRRSQSRARSCQMQCRATWPAIDGRIVWQAFWGRATGAAAGYRVHPPYPPLPVVDAAAEITRWNAGVACPRFDWKRK